MAKKLPLLILTLTISTLAATVPKPASAAVWYDNTTWWSVEEMLDFYQQVEQDKAELGGSDNACIEDFNMTMIEKGQKYSALDNLIQGQFWITSINPKAETIKVLFFDQDRMLAHMGIDRKIALQSFYLAWFDNWEGQIYNFYRPQFISGEIEDLHTVYDSIAEELDTAHFPARREIEIAVPGSDLPSNTFGRLDAAVFGSEGFNSMGYTDYSDCLNAPDYEEGMECKMMVSGDKWISFFPPRAEIVEPDPIITSDTPDTPDVLVAPDTTDEPSDSAIIIDVTTEDPEPATNDPANDTSGAPGKGSASTTSESKAAPIIYTNAYIPPKAPDTGAYPAEACSREINMPWWIIALILAGNALLIWWFMPNRRHFGQNSSKSSKKSQKSIDITRSF